MFHPAESCPRLCHTNVTRPFESIVTAGCCCTPTVKLLTRNSPPKGANVDRSAAYRRAWTSPSPAHDTTKLPPPSIAADGDRSEPDAMRNSGPTGCQTPYHE